MAEKNSMIAPGGMIGILGGGQLGRMLSMAAAELGYRCHLFEPEAEPPAGDVCARLTTAYYTDEIALASFARDVDVVTYEFENVPVETVEMLSDIKPVRPGVKALSIAQDRLLEKQFAVGLDVQTAPFVGVDSQADLDAAIAKIGLPAILKTRRMGYDGKGQVAIREPGDAAAALNAIGGEAAILEGFVDFQCEVSVIAARGNNGEIKCYPPAENEHKNHILDVTRLPAAISPEAAEKALEIARKFVEALDYVGVLAVEMFVTEEGLVLVNEIAPRVHNSGHWSIEGAPASQFEQHIRAICGLPLGDPTPYGEVEMKNLIGDDAIAWAEILADPKANLHLYGKKEIRAGRKMGHVTKVKPARRTS
jgi:5-(carboxyamino)imidazole ribonucleotide synthase